MHVAEKSRPTRTVLDEVAEYLAEWWQKAAEEAACQAAQRHINRIEIEQSQKAMTERMRDRWFY